MMNRQEITALSEELILRYYDNDVAPFLEHLDDDALWYGPAEGQILRGRESMVAAWAVEDNPLTFTVSDLRVTTVSPGPSLCIVVLHFSVVTHYPGGNDLAVSQRVTLTWYERPAVKEQGNQIKTPRIVCCDVTNPHPKSMDDSIYFTHIEQVLPDTVSMPRLDGQRGERLRFRGIQGMEYYLYSNSIIWGGSCANGRRCLLHLAGGSTAEVAAPVRTIAESYPSLFLHCHASHFVNPVHVRSLRRFAVTMADGAELSVPEKSYTKFKKALNEFT